ncbi:MAG: histidine phosphatase family protein [Bacteroidota bacterium]
MSKLYFFRHAQASFGKENYDSLSSKGESQSLQLGKYLVEKKMLFDRVFVGPLKRQVHTFELVKSMYDQHGLPMPEPVFLDGLTEHQGPEALQIMLPTLRERSPFKERIAEMKANPKRSKANSLLMFQHFMDAWVEEEIDVEGVVAWKDFRENTRKGLETILKTTGSGETNAAFTSGGTISAIAAEALNIGGEKNVAALNFSIRNTSFTSFLYSRGKFNLLGLNEIPHLAEELITFV